MKKFFRKLFSPLFLTAFVSLLEILLILAIFGICYFILDTAAESFNAGVYFFERVLLSVVEFIIYLYIVNKKENPEYKIPWITAIFVTPLLTFILYLFFANHGLKRRDRKIVENTNQQLDECFKLGDEEIEKFREEVPLRYRSVFKYLRNTTRLSNSCNNSVTYFKNGETFFPELVESLKKAEKFIFIEFFIIGEGKWWSQIEEVLLDKAKQGVEVRLIYDDLGAFGILPNNYHKKLRKKGIKCYKFHPFKPKLSGTYNNRDHRKIAVIDNKMAFTGGMNLADEYANDEIRFGYWKDTMVKIEGRGVANLIATFLSNYDLAARSKTNFSDYVNGEYEEYDEDGYVFAFGDGPGGYTHNEPIGEENYLQLIERADRTIYISTPYLIPTYRLMEALKKAATRGVNIKLFVPGIPDKKLVYWLAKSNFNELIHSGVHIYIYKPGFNHEKQMVVDDIMAFCGTINFDFRSLAHHFECGVTMYGTPCIKDMVQDFKEMEELSKLEKEGYKLNVFQRALISLVNIFRTLL